MAPVSSLLNPVSAFLPHFHCVIRLTVGLTVAYHADTSFRRDVSSSGWTLRQAYTNAHKRTTIAQTHLSSTSLENCRQKWKCCCKLVQNWLGVISQCFAEGRWESVRDEMCLTDDLYTGCSAVMSPTERNYCCKQRLASHKCIYIHLTWRWASRCHL